MATGFFSQRTNDRAAFTDHVTDFFRIDLHGVKLRRKITDFGFGLAHGFLHFAQNVHTRFFGLGQSHLHDLLGDALDFDVHLQSSDAIGGASHFEVHVAQMIFVTQNVGQHSKAVAILDQAHGNASHMRFHGNTRVHHGQATAADGRHGRRSVGFGDFRHHTQGVGKFFFGGQTSCQSTLGQTAVAYFAALGGTHATDFAGSKGRHVVVEHEAVFKLTSQCVDALGIAFCTQGGDDQGLCFATGEQG